MIQPVVQLSAVTKRYGETEALRGIDLSIAEGEVVAVLGPNGAGKTTSIAIALGLRRPTTGTALLFGRDPRDPEARARCGVMLQESGVPALLTVRETIALFRSHYAAPLPIAKALALARLEDKARSLVSNLSGGERQRLYYALAVCGDPMALFLDEPTVGMDVVSRHALLADIAQFARVGKTIVLTTHYIEEAERLAQRVVVIDHGRVIANGTPAEIRGLVPAKRVRFRVRDGVAPPRFDALPVHNVHVGDGEVSFLSDDPAGVIAALAGAGTTMADLEVGGADLEEAFLVLTGMAR